MIQGKSNLLMKKILAFFAIILISGCDFLPGPLTDEDIEKYVAAYENIAEVSPILEKQKKDSNSSSVLTCTECYSTLNDAVVKAGYKDLKDFLIADTRIHLTLRYYTYAQITKIVGEASNGVTPEEFCAIPEHIQNSKDPQEVKKQCENIKVWAGYLKTISNAIYAIAEKLLTDGDIAVVAKNIEGIEKALFNPKLVDDFRHVRGGGFDD